MHSGLFTLALLEEFVTMFVHLH